MTEANFVDVHHHVEDEASCHDLCAIFDAENCEYFTYFNDESEFPNLCFLYNDCAQNNTDCSGCIHGPNECTFCSWAETEAGTCDAYGGTIVERGGAATPTTTTTSIGDGHTFLAKHFKKTIYQFSQGYH